MAYTTNHIDDFLEDDNERLYKKGCVNFTGIDADGTLYIEYIAKKILDNNDKYLSIDTVHRENYKIQTHDGNSDNDTSDFHAEVLVAKRLFKQTFDCLGEIIDYEVPLKKTNNDEADKKANIGVGKIDLLAYDKNNILNIIELKNSVSTETLLRCILEIESYSRFLHSGNLLESYGYSKTTRIEKAILIFKDTEPYKPFTDKEKYPNLLKLLETFEISVYILSKDEKTIIKES